MILARHPHREFPYGTWVAQDPSQDRKRSLISTQPIVWIARDLDYMLLVRRNFRRNGIDNPIVLLTSGELALAYIRTSGDTISPSTSPLVVVTEISLPQMDGYEVLRQLKLDPRFVDLPVLLIATTEPFDFQKTEPFPAVHFLQRPPLEGIPALVETIIQRWVHRR